MEEPHKGDEKALDDNRNGTDAEICDKKSSDDLTAILDELSLGDETAQAQLATATNGKGKSGKKNKKKSGKVEEQVSTSSDALKA